MSDGVYGLALAAGMLATVNPCGFVLLPTYVSLLVATEPAASAAPAGAARLRAVGRALAMTGAMTAGFVAVFAAFGLVVTPLALSIERYSRPARPPAGPGRPAGARLFRDPARSGRNASGQASASCR